MRAGNWEQCLKGSYVGFGGRAVWYFIDTSERLLADGIDKLCIPHVLVYFFMVLTNSSQQSPSQEIQVKIFSHFVEPFYSTPSAKEPAALLHAKPDKMHFLSRFPLYFKSNIIFSSQQRVLLFGFSHSLTLTPLTWRIWWAPNNTSRWQMGFKLAFKGLKTLKVKHCVNIET